MLHAAEVGKALFSMLHTAGGRHSFARCVLQWQERHSSAGCMVQRGRRHFSACRVLQRSSEGILLHDACSSVDVEATKEEGRGSNNEHSNRTAFQASVVCFILLLLKERENLKPLPITIHGR